MMAVLDETGAHFGGSTFIAVVFLDVLWLLFCLADLTTFAMARYPDYRRLIQKKRYSRYCVQTMWPDVQTAQVADELCCRGCFAGNPRHADFPGHARIFSVYETRVYFRNEKNPGCLQSQNRFF